MRHFLPLTVFAVLTFSACQPQPPATAAGPVAGKVSSPAPKNFTEAELAAFGRGLTVSGGEAAVLTGLPVIRNHVMGLEDDSLTGAVQVNRIAALLGSYQLELRADSGVGERVKLVAQAKTLRFEQTLELQPVYASTGAESEGALPKATEAEAAPSQGWYAGFAFKNHFWLQAGTTWQFTVYNGTQVVLQTALEIPVSESLLSPSPQDSPFVGPPVREALAGKPLFFRWLPKPGERLAVYRQLADEDYYPVAVRQWTGSADLAEVKLVWSGAESEGTYVVRILTAEMATQPLLRQPLFDNLVVLLQEPQY